LRCTGIESHNNLGTGEQIYSRIRMIFNKISADHPELPSNLRLSIAIKAINDTAGPEGIVPSLLAFGALPRPLEFRKNFLPRVLAF
jgi:hypothetical protein